MERIINSTKTNRIVGIHGESIIDDMVRAIHDPCLTLAAIGRKYGFSRERARQLFIKVNGISYTSIKSNKSNIKKAHKICNRIDPGLRRQRSTGNSSSHKGTRAEDIFFNKCRSMGFNVVPLFNKVDFLVNNKMVEFKSAYSYIVPYKKTGKKYFHFGTVSPNERENLDFLVCFIVTNGEYYIIPKHEIGTGISIPDSSYKNLRQTMKISRFIKYKNAWNLLG